MKRVFAAIITVVLLCFCAIPAFAEAGSDLTEGAYYIKSSLSCYVNAMGGIEFGAPLLQSSQIEVGSDGSKTMTLFLTKSSVTIYGVTCDTFVDASPSYATETNGIKSGTLGFYDSNDILNTENISYTLSNDTAQNAQGELVHYVDSVSFPIAYECETYHLSLFVNSNVMGTQFTLDGYPAVLTVDWSSVLLEKAETGEESKETEHESAPSIDVDSVESKDGLNIYHADDTVSSDGETVASGTYVAYFQESLLIAVGITAGVMILAGMILVIAGRKENKA